MTNLERAHEIVRLGLTPRLYELAGLVSQGLPNKLIAYQMGLTEGTVKQYVNRLIETTKQDNRVKIAVWYVRNTEIKQ